MNNIALTGRSVGNLTMALVRLFQAVRSCEQRHSLHTSPQDHQEAALWY